MTAKEAAAAARARMPVIFEDEFFGPMLFRRISEISKIYPEDGEPERYEVRLASMTGSGGMENCPLEQVRLAAPEEIENGNRIGKEAGDENDDRRGCEGGARERAGSV